jgi:hypothetical protein
MKEINYEDENNTINILRKILKYLVMGIVVMTSIRYIPLNPIDNKEILIIGFISSITFSLLDMVSPSIKLN